MRVAVAIIAFITALATLILDVVPFVWMGGFILAGYLIFREFEDNQKIKREKEKEERFDIDEQWQVKATGEQDLSDRLQSISKQYGPEFALRYLENIEKLSSEQSFNILTATLFSSPKRKIMDDPCRVCEGYGFTKEIRRGLFGEIQKKVTCSMCKGEGGTPN